MPSTSYALKKFFKDLNRYCNKKASRKKINEITGTFFKGHNHSIKIPSNEYTDKFVKDFMDRRAYLQPNDIDDYCQKIAEPIWEQVAPSSLTEILKIQNIEDKGITAIDVVRQKFKELAQAVQKENPPISTDKQIFILMVFLLAFRGDKVLFHSDDLFRQKFNNVDEFLEVAIQKLLPPLPSLEENDGETTFSAEELENMPSGLRELFGNTPTLKNNVQKPANGLETTFEPQESKELKSSEDESKTSSSTTTEENEDSELDKEEQNTSSEESISQDENPSTETQEAETPPAEPQEIKTVQVASTKDADASQSRYPREEEEDEGDPEQLESSASLHYIRSNYMTGQMTRSGKVWTFHPLYEWTSGKPMYITDAAAQYGPDGIMLSNMDALFSGSTKQLYQGGLYTIDITDNEPRRISPKLSAIDGLQLFRNKKIWRADDDKAQNEYWRAYYVVEPATDNWAIEDDTLEVKIAGHRILPSQIEDLFGIYVLLNIGSSLIGPLLLQKNGRGYLTVKLHSGDSTFCVYDSYEANNDTIRPMDAIRTPDAIGAVFTYPLFTRHRKIDLISDSGLLKFVASNMPLKREDIAKVLEWSKTYPFSKNKNEITLSNERIKRIHDIFTEGRRAVDVITSLGPLVSDLLNREVEENSDFISEAAKAFASNPHAMALLHTDENFKKGLENLAIQEKEYRDKIKKLAETYNKDKIERENEIKELAGTKKVAKLNEDIKNLTEELKKFEKERNEQEEEIKRRRASLQDAESQLEGFEKRLDETVGKVASLAFEGSITAKIMEAADQWRAQKADSTYKSRVSALRNLQKRSDSGKTLNDELCSVLHSIRKYGHNEYVNLFVCLAQSFLTVLAGSPGSGKTSLCNYVARLFGLTSLKDQNGIGELWSDHPNYANRYIPISVERGWTSKRDLIGYFNPLSRTFESVDPHRFECFKQLDYEAKEKFEELPYFLLLDEANLSPMEYYFADFMNICDIRNDLSFVSIGGDSRFQIPDSLRFLATINNDHTTEMLSPRLVDRTWIILLPETEELDIPEQEANKKLDHCGIIDWNLFRKTYAPRSKPNSPIQEDLKNISHRLSSLGLVLSPRTRTAIANYVSAAQSHMKKEGTRAPYKVALDYAVAQKILPMINGSGTSYKASLDSLKEFLNTEKLTKSASALEQVIRKGTDKMDFYRFF